LKGIFSLFGLLNIEGFKLLMFGMV